MILAPLVAVTMRCIDMRSGTPRIALLPATTPAQRKLIAVQAQLYRRHLDAHDQSAGRDGGTS